MSEIFELTAKAFVGDTNQSSNNVYHYWVDDQFVPTVDACQELADGWISAVMPATLPILSVQYKLYEVYVKSMSNTAEYAHSFGTPQLGTRPGVAAPAQLVWAYKLLRSSSATKSGGKRYSPIARDDVTGAGAPAGPIIATNLTLLESALMSTIAIPSEGFTAQLIIWGRWKNKLPVSIINPVLAARFIESTSQKTRQRGIGS